MAVLVGFLLYSIFSMWGGQKLYQVNKNGWYIGVWLLGLGIAVSFALPMITEGGAPPFGWAGSIIGLIYLYIRKDEFHE
jgi:hypothetical protein